MSDVHTHTFNGTVSASVGFSGSGAALTDLPRSAVDAGTLGDVVINDATTGLLSSEAKLAVARGGFGLAVSWESVDGSVDPGSSGMAVSGVLPAVLAGTTGAFGKLAAATTSVPGALVLRDAYGDVVSGSALSLLHGWPVATASPSPASLAIDASHTSGGGLVQTQCRTTTGSPSTVLLTMTAPAATPGDTTGDMVLSIAGQVVLAASSQAVGSVSTGAIELRARAYYSTTWRLDASSITLAAADLDTALVGCSLSLTSSTSHLILLATQPGGAPAQIDWVGALQLTWSLVRA